MFGFGGIPGGLQMTHVTSSGPAESRLFTTPDLGGTDAGSGGPIAVAWNGGLFPVVSMANSPAPVHGVLIEDSFNVVKPAFPIATAASTRASGASDGSDFVVTWVGTARPAAGAA